MSSVAGPGVVGIIPAAGRGVRLGRLPFCKELYPLGYREATGGAGQPQPIVVSQDLIERMAEAGVRRIFVVISPGKSEIMKYFGDGSRLGVELAYLVQEEPRGMPFALDLARTWLSGETTLFGMPDTIIRPRSAHQRLLAEHARASADVTLGVFPTDQPERFGMVDIDDHGRVVGNVDKPASTSLRYMWGFACWSQHFGAVMAEYLREVTTDPSEVVLSSVFQRAIDRGLRVVAVKFDDGEYIDIGTASSMRQPLHRFVDD